MYILLPTFFGFTNARDFLHTLDGIICPVPLYGIYRPLKFKDTFLLSLLKTSRGSKDAHCFSILVRKRYRTRRTFTVPGLNVHPNWLNLRCWPQEELQECTESGAFAGNWPQCEPLPCSIGGGQAIQICCVDCWNWSSYWNKSYVGDRCMLLKIILNDKKYGQHDNHLCWKLQGNLPVLPGVDISNCLNLFAGILAKLNWFLVAAGM